MTYLGIRANDWCCCFFFRREEKSPEDRWLIFLSAVLSLHGRLGETDWHFKWGTRAGRKKVKHCSWVTAECLQCRLLSGFKPSGSLTQSGPVAAPILLLILSFLLHIDLRLEFFDLRLTQKPQGASCVTERLLKISACLYLTRTDEREFNTVTYRLQECVLHHIQRERGEFVGCVYRCKHIELYVREHFLNWTVS